MRLFRFLISFCFLLWSLSTLNYPFSIPAAYAAGEFLTRFTSIYDITTEGVTHVIHQIELTNRLSDVYSNEYTLTIGSTRVKDITAESPGGVDTQVSLGQNNTQIKLKFQNPTVGKDQTQRFSVSYTNLDIATKNGRVLEVNIPKMGNSNDIDDYSAVIKVPDSFDAPTLMNPPTKSITHVGNQQVLRYGKQSLSNKGLSILFGDHQIYDFTLRYTLHNPGITQASTQIALPPDTAYQKMFYQDLNPQPQNITIDADGNWLAQYTLKPKQTLEIRTSGQVQLYLKPTVPLAASTQPNYLKASRYWETNDPEIKNLAEKLKTPENIYNYLVANLKYNETRIGNPRLGAKTTLERPQDAICTEFTDLFVALARAAGIPARAHEGFAFTANPKLRPLSLKLDVLHAWPEYYDQAQLQWIPVDPTWGNTTGGIDYFSRWDLNHFTFAIHGQDSEYPYPAGAYKISSTNGKDVNVAFSFNKPQEHMQLTATFVPTSALVNWGKPVINLIIKNQGNIAAYQTPLAISAVGYNISVPQSIDTIPPFGKYTIPVELSTAFPFFKSTTLVAKINNTTSTYEISSPHFSVTTLTLAIVASLVASLISTVAYLSWRVRFHRK